MDNFDREKALECIMPSVKSQLKAPITAVFCQPSELRVTGGYDGTYTVEGMVNSQNSFGAMIATDFKCSVRCYNDRYSVVSCTVGQQAAIQEAKASAGRWIWAIIITLGLSAFFYWIYSSMLGI